jgi:glycosyltransferase involved in cell wall biosynthesis
VTVCTDWDTSASDTSKIMNVGIVADKLDVGGGGSNFSLELLANRLERRGHDVTVITVHFAHENDLPASHEFEIRPHPLDGDSRPAKARAGVELFGRLDGEFDVLHVFNPALLPIAGWAVRKGAATPVVGRLNTYDVFCTNLAKMDGKCHENCTIRKKYTHEDAPTVSKLTDLPKYAFDTFAFPRLVNNLDMLFAISPTVAEVYSAIGVDERLVELVPNFFDPEFPGDGGAEVSFDHDQTILYVGGLAEFKGVRLLVKAVPQLPEGIGVSFVGEGDALESLKKLASNLGVKDRVRFHGRVDHADLASYYRGAELFVHPGLLPEPFGRTILEAIQCGCPPAVSDIGGPPWVVGDCGVVFDRDDPEDLAMTVGDALSDPDRLASLEARCSDRLERFSPDRVGPAIEDHYRAVIEANDATADVRTATETDSASDSA